MLMSAMLNPPISNQFPMVNTLLLGSNAPTPMKIPSAIRFVQVNAQQLLQIQTMDTATKTMISTIISVTAWMDLPLPAISASTARALPQLAARKAGAEDLPMHAAQVVVAAVETGAVAEAAVADAVDVAVVIPARVVAVERAAEIAVLPGLLLITDRIKCNRS
jgi:hypothetical protein